MVKDTLHKNAPDERFDKKVVDELLTGPNLLKVRDHPVKKVWDKVRKALSQYEVVHGEEIVDWPSFENKDEQAIWDDRIDRMAYRATEDKILRTHTTITVLTAVRDRIPPVRVLVAGRVFSHDGIPTGIGDAHGIRTFHMLDGICIENCLSAATLQGTCEAMIRAILGHVGIDWIARDYSEGFVEHGMEARINLGEVSKPLSGFAMLTPSFLKECGYDADIVRGGHFGLALDLAAMLKVGTNDIHKLWQPPYIP